MIQHTHDEFNTALKEIKEELGIITGHLTSNGGFSVIFKSGRMKFTGSLPIKKVGGWTALIVALAGTGVGSTLLGWWS